ncbi:MAG: hypothetical protein AB1489_04130 [Acidobacteriota bacterium]
MFGLNQTTSNKEVAFDVLKANDKLIIRTKNSQYQFRVTDPVDRRGILSGGQLGNEAHEAVLLCVAPDNSEQLHNKSIKINSKAIFFLLQTSLGVQRLHTSSITDVKLVSSH